VAGLVVGSSSEGVIVHRRSSDKRGFQKPEDEATGGFNIRGAKGGILTGGRWEKRFGLAQAVFSSTATQNVREATGTQI